MLLDKNPQQGRIGLIFIVVLSSLLITSLLSTYFLLSKNSLLLQFASYLKHPTAQNSIASLSIDPKLENVPQAGVYYTLNGQVSRLQYRGGVYTIDLVTNAGQPVVKNLKIYESIISYVTAKDPANNTTSPISLAGLSNGDLVEIQLNGNLKTGDYTVTSLTKINI